MFKFTMNTGKVIACVIALRSAKQCIAVDIYWSKFHQIGCPGIVFLSYQMTFIASCKTNVSIVSEPCFPPNPSSLFAGYKTEFQTLQCISCIISLPVIAQNAEEGKYIKKHPCKITNIKKIYKISIILFKEIVFQVFFLQTVVSIFYCVQALTHSISAVTS